MKWKLISQTEKSRTYQSQHGTECITDLIHTDNMGNKWFGFRDLFKIPYIRIVFAKSISDLFQAGLTAADIKGWIAKERELLKSNDSEKYEKLFALLLEKEATINNTIDPVKQHLALCSIYVLAEDERIDYFDQDEAAKKVALWNVDKQSAAFFLSWHASHIQNYTHNLNLLSRIASNLQP